MSNRILKQDICMSEEIEQLNWFEEVLFYRLIVNCDDYGCFDRRAKIIKGSLFPLKEVTTKQIDAAIDKLSTVGLVRVYEVQGRPYLQLTTWSKHQRLRSTKHKYPTPEEADLRQSAATCGDLRQSAATCGLARASLRIQSESESEYEYESESEYYCTEQSPDCAMPAAARPKEEPAEADVPAVILNDGSEWRPSVVDVEEWAKLYPGIDIATEFGRMRQWCKDNPKKRKTRSGVRRFARGWLDREQNRGWKKNAPKENKFNQFEQNHYDFDQLEKELLSSEQSDINGAPD